MDRGNKIDTHTVIEFVLSGITEKGVNDKSTNEICRTSGHSKSKFAIVVGQYHLILIQ